MSEITVNGKVKFVGPEVNVSSSFTKRELVVTTDEQYPQHILINFTQGKCNPDLDKLKVGDAVSVSINLRGREWVNPQGETKYFNDIQGWRISNVQPAYTAPPQPQQQTQTAPQQTTQQSANFNEEEHDDLPF